jgi:kexin
VFPTLLPSIPSVTTPENPSPTKTYGKPGDHLPTDHGSAPGENTKPAFDTGNSSVAATPSAAASASMTPTADEGWFAGMGSLAANGKWVFGAGALVLLFGAGVGVFFWRRAAARRAREASYAQLPGDSVAMGAMPGGPRGAKELYDAFGEGEDDEDADEQTRLAPGRVHDPSSAGVGFHSGFLDDEEASAAGTPASAKQRYHDEPGEDEKLEEASGSGSRDSADGSWEHASQIQTR